jgi:ATP-dependent 26S proteasome regulatory subunit
VTQGLKPGLSTGKTSNLPAELEVLAQMHEAPEYTVFLVKDFHPYMRDNRVVRLLRDLSGRLRTRAQTLILTSPMLTLPPELEKDVTVIEFPMPDTTVINAQLDSIISSLAGNDKVDLNLEPDERELIVNAAQGLTADEIESALARSLVIEKRLSPSLIVEEKKQIVRKSGILEFYPVQQGMKDVGGLELLKEWLDKRKGSLTQAARDFGIPYPKGVLLMGVQGCGKSLVAKAIANAYRLPILKMDVGRIFGGLVGQSEENMRKAIRIAESLAPCVLWIDELEKGFAGTGSSGVSDSGTTARVFSTFLTWMQDKTKPVFLVATANDVTALPPELLRKGRFDEVFFIDLPAAKDRALIFKIHLEKRGRKGSKFKHKNLAEATRGFSGAEIEQVVIGGLHHAFDEGRELTMKDLLDEAAAQVPLSRMMAEDIALLRSWAKMRARPSAAETVESD